MNILRAGLRRKRKSDRDRISVDFLLDRDLKGLSDPDIRKGLTF